ncbi:hypothetical protein BD413DRAFT_231101 [Trametes elegans]|nr:hypothetical protein BD413DRAFT_231101 [Trametes elegans]
MYVCLYFYFSPRRVWLMRARAAPARPGARAHVHLATREGGVFEARSTPALRAPRVVEAADRIAAIVSPHRYPLRVRTIDTTRADASTLPRILGGSARRRLHYASYRAWRAPGPPFPSPPPPSPPLLRGTRLAVPLLLPSHSVLDIPVIFMSNTPLPLRLPPPVLDAPSPCSRTWTV